jgi:hypothetical protein
MSNLGSASLTYITAAGNSAPSGGGIAVMAGSNSAVKSIGTVYQNPLGGNLSVAQYGSFLRRATTSSPTPPVLRWIPPTWSTPTRCWVRSPTTVGRPSPKPCFPAAPRLAQGSQLPGSRPTNEEPRGRRVVLPTSAPSRSSLRKPSGACGGRASITGRPSWC